MTMLYPTFHTIIKNAKTVTSGYLPNVDTILQSKKGICFDYAAVMATMLRTQGIPTKLVVGYAGSAYHAWVSVYINEIGWIDNIFYFDGKSWVRMDPTFASSGNSSASIMNVYRRWKKATKQCMLTKKLHGS